MRDIALWLGDVLIARHPQLRWVLCTHGKAQRNVSYQRPVIMGFSVPNPRYNVDYDWRVVIYGRGLLGETNTWEDAFVSFLAIDGGKTAGPFDPGSHER